MKTTLPTVGIRPIIDGRRLGVRESLEDQTMGMAKRAAELITSTLRHSCGAPGECVIADSTIGGPAEADACEEKFKKHNVGLTLSVTPCWCYGAETIDMDPQRPKAIWGFNGTERPGAVYLAAALAAHTQKGIPAFSIYGKDVQDATDTTMPEDVAEKILRFVRAGLAVATMKGKGYLSIGGCSMGIAGSIVDHSFWEKYLGIRVQCVDMTEVRRRMDLKMYDEEELDKALAWADEHFIFGVDVNNAQYVRDERDSRRVLKESLLMGIIFRDLMKGNPKIAKKGFIEEGLGYNSICAGFQGQRNWTDYYPNGDTAESILNSTFDWNGPRAPIPFATENDALNGVTQLFGYLLTGRAQVFADVRTYWSPDAVKRVTGHQLKGDAANGIIHLINSGSAAIDGTGAMKDKDGKPVMKQHWDVTEDDAKKCMAKAKWCPAVSEYFRGGGFSLNYLTEGGMPLTMCRLNIVKGIGPVMIIVEGTSVDLPEKVHNTLNERTDRTWPTTWFAPRLTGKGIFTDVYSVMANVGANHGVVSYGHIGADMITLASMLRIPVFAHNVCECKVYRPSAWALHGTTEPESADFRACSNYGPLYGKY